MTDLIPITFTRAAYETLAKSLDAAVIPAALGADIIVLVAASYSRTLRMIREQADEQSLCPGYPIRPHWQIVLTRDTWNVIIACLAQHAIDAANRQLHLRGDPEGAKQSDRMTDALDLRKHIQHACAAS